MKNLFSEWNNESSNIFFQNLFRTFDENHDNHIDFKELIIGLSVLCRGTISERIDCNLYY